MRLWQIVRRYPFLSWLTAADLLLIAGGWTWLVAALWDVRPFIILHFNELVGINQVGTLWDIHRVASLAFLVVLADYALAVELEARDRFLSRVAAGFAFLFSVLIFVAFAVIINVNK